LRIIVKDVDGVVFGSSKELRCKHGGKLKMDERSKELIAIFFGVSLCVLVSGYSFYTCFLSHQEHTIKFKVFDAYYHEGKSGTQILTWGVGKFFFLGNWTGQFYEGNTYRVTYVRQSGWGKHTLIVLEREEIIDS